MIATSLRSTCNGQLWLMKESSFWGRGGARTESTSRFSRPERPENTSIQRMPSAIVASEDQLHEIALHFNVSCQIAVGLGVERERSMRSRCPPRAEAEQS